MINASDLTGTGVPGMVGAVMTSPFTMVRVRSFYSVTMQNQVHLS